MLNKAEEKDSDMKDLDFSAYMKNHNIKVKRIKKKKIEEHKKEYKSEIINNNKEDEDNNEKKLVKIEI